MGKYPRPLKSVPEVHRADKSYWHLFLEYLMMSKSKLLVFIFFVVVFLYQFMVVLWDIIFMQW